MGSIAKDGLAAWHALVRAPSAEALDALLAADVVFHSPILHAPQPGRALTRMYLLAAFEVLAAEARPPSSGEAGEAGEAGETVEVSKPSATGARVETHARGESRRTPRFRYVREVVGERDAVLEFVSEIDGIVINGVDMIRWNDAGRIVDFKVMVRPRKAVDAIQAAMARMLERLKSA